MMIFMKLALAGPVLLVMVTTAVVSTAAPVLYTTNALAIGPPFADPPVFLVNQLNTLSTMDGSPTLVGDFGVDGVMAGLAYDAGQEILYGTDSFNDTLYSIDPSTGATTLIGLLGGERIHGLAFDGATGTLLGAPGLSGDGLYQIDTSTGAATLIGHIGFFFEDPRDTVSGLGFHPQTNVLYGSISGPNRVGKLITIDTSTGKGSPIAETQPLTGIAFHPVTGDLYGVDNGAGLDPDALYAVDIVTGLATFIGETQLLNNLGLEFLPGELCDFDGVNGCDINDIDALVAEIVAGSNDLSFDLNGDGLVTLEDVTEVNDGWLRLAGAENLGPGLSYLPADITLDGFVDGLDFIEWNANKFLTTGLWSLGDLNADGFTDGLDFIIWNANKFTSSDGVSAVPEPGMGVLLIAGLMGLVVVRRR
jgi:hypothetical protein